MKIPNKLMAFGLRVAAPLVHRLGTIAGGTLLGWGLTGEQSSAVMGALAVLVGVAADVMVKKLNEGSNGAP